jgi:hypothetical protein
MKRRYFELLADVTEGKKTIEQADAAMHHCSADEEPAYHALRPHGMRLRQWSTVIVPNIMCFRGGRALPSNYSDSRVAISR